MMQGVHIEVMAYRGKNGSYAREHVPLWIARIVGTDGTKRLLDQSNWHGDTDERHAMRNAEDWASFLGVSVVRVDGGELLGGHAPE
jgi:hypothetical protein